MSFAKDDTTITTVTRTKYEVTIKHNGIVSVEDIIEDFEQVPENAVLCGFDDNANYVSFTFVKEEKTKETT